MNSGTLLIRADASGAIGSGHIARCLALAQGWRAGGGTAVFAMSESTPAIEQRLAEERCRVVHIDGAPGSDEDCSGMCALAGAESPSWIVFDSYALDSRYRQAIQESGQRCLVVDDNGGNEFFGSDLVLNQNLHACELMYPNHASQTRLLLGAQYAMLRDEFAPYREWSRTIPERAMRVLVTMGGSDPTNFTPRVLSSLVQIPAREVDIRVIIGGSSEHASAVEEAASLLPGRVALLRDVRNMAELMAWADLAIAGAGTTCWEMCLLGLPAILIVAAQNQEAIARGMASAGAAFNAGQAREVDCDALAKEAEKILMSSGQRRAMSQAARNLVDGRGRERVLDAMRAGDRGCA
jgi:UDP-2,4-diacetamido-2,4,6-trideoxy-beta-L-altropyranose hydrolase